MRVILPGTDKRSKSKKSRRKSGENDAGSGFSTAGAKAGGFVVLNEADFVTAFEARDAKKVT